MRLWVVLGTGTTNPAEKLVGVIGEKGLDWLKSSDSRFPRYISITDLLSSHAKLTVPADGSPFARDYPTTTTLASRVELVRNMVSHVGSEEQTDIIGSDESRLL